MSSSQSTRNALFHLFDGVFFFAALIMFSREIIIPRMIEELSDSVFLVGLVQMIAWLGVLIPQTAYAKRIEGLPRKKGRVLFWLVVQRVGWAVFLGSLMLVWSPAVTLTVFFAIHALASLGSGFIMPVWIDWYAKTVPESIWGRLLGYRRASPGLLGIGLGLLIDRVMAQFEAPARYQILAAGALLFFILSGVCVALVREEADEGLPHQRDLSWGAYFRGLVRILTGRRDFRRFMIAAACVSTPLALLASFLTRYGLTYPGIEDGITGTFTQVLYVFSAAGAFVGGFLSDRRGAMVPFLVFPIFGAVAAALVCFGPHPLLVSLAFAVYGLGFGIRMVVVLPAVLKFAGPHRRPSYMAVSFTLLSLPYALLPPALGLMLDGGVLEWRHVFAGCAVLSALGWVMFLRIPEPLPDGH